MSGFPQYIKTKYKRNDFQNVVNTNSIKFKSYGNLVDQVFLQYNENLINNRDPQSQIEDDEAPRVEYPNENDSESTESNKTSAVPNSIPKTLADDEIAEGINSLH